MNSEVAVADKPVFDETQYRTLASSAVASLVLGLLSAVAVLDWLMLVVPVLGSLVAIYSWRSIRSRPLELTGLKLAQGGLLLSVLFFVSGLAWLSYTYAVEVPEGYRRIAYDVLQPDPDRPSQKIPESAKALDGQKVFIKGYVMPGMDQNNIQRFLLVADQGDCCFGGNPKITDRVQVTLADPERLTFRPRMHKLAGVFRVVNLDRAVGGAPGGVYYVLDEAHLR